ncbi:uncharacterized protein [Aquarana catesbeiana]|uniref:uncharacterized protein n=1 Tax=Aquarana catesbeiana TaxID=8400 RepID=UPI003CCA4FD4
METNYLKEMNCQDNPLPTNTQYRKAIGKLLYLTTATRPDIAATVGILCRKVSMSSKKDWNAVKRIIRYLKGISHYKLKLPASDESTLTGYVDADWAGDTSDRKSTSGHLFFLSGGAISWIVESNSVTLSSTEAEYVVAEQASQEVIWLNRLGSTTVGTNRNL